MKRQSAPERALLSDNGKNEAIEDRWVNEMLAAYMLKKGLMLLWIPISIPFADLFSIQHSVLYCSCLSAWIYSSMACRQWGSKTASFELRGSRREWTETKKDWYDEEKQTYSLSPRSGNCLASASGKVGSDRLGSLVPVNAPSLYLPNRQSINLTTQARKDSLGNYRLLCTRKKKRGSLFSARSVWSSIFFFESAALE